MNDAAQQESLNLAAHLDGMPPVYDRPPQDDTARAYAQSLMRILRAGRKPDKTEMEWLTLYNKHKAKSRNRDEADEYIEEYNKKDLQLFFMDKITKLQNDYDKRVAELIQQHRKDLAEKDKRIDEIVSRQQDQKGKDFAEMVRLVANAAKDGADNANKHLSTALTTTNSLNTTLLSTMQTQWQNVGNLSKKHFEELNKILAEKEKDEPGFFEMFITEVILPNKDKIGEGLSKLAGPMLTQP